MKSLQETLKYRSEGRMTHASFSARRELSQMPHTGGIYVTRNNLGIIAEFTDVHVNVRAQERNAQ